MKHSEDDVLNDLMRIELEIEIQNAYAIYGFGKSFPGVGMA